jgi:hypothetical protein
MKYYITTLAVGEPYFSKSLEFHKALSQQTEHAFFNITTTEQDIQCFEEGVGVSLEEYLKEFEKVKVTTLSQFVNPDFTFPLRKQDPVDFAFNLNLKVISLKACLQSGNDFDYLFFIDGDWSLHENFQESKIFKAIEYLEYQNVDFAFERPAQIGPYKTDPNCFFPQKVRDYNILEHSIWDEAHVVNEQFLLFKNSWKFRLFTQKWEMMLWYSIANNHMNYPDGFEIGIAALESQMKWSFYGVFLALDSCFYFYTKYGTDKNIRF